MPRRHMKQKLKVKQQQDCNSFALDCKAAHVNQMSPSSTVGTFETGYLIRMMTVALIALRSGSLVWLHP